MTLTGQGSAESAIAIASDGTLFYSPAFGNDGNGVVRSRDKGATWEHLVPRFPDGTGHGRTQPYMYLDPATDRLFFLTSRATGSGGGGSGFDLSTSTDQGATWSYQTFATEAKDWIKVFAGPAVTSHPSGYPDVVYASAPTPISTPGTIIYPQPDKQFVYKSLDGGATWNVVGKLPLNPSDEVTAGLADAATCPSSEMVIFGSGMVGKDGTLVLGFRMCTDVAIATSQDEGATWTTSVVPGAAMPPYSAGIATWTTVNNLLLGEPVAVDDAGNIYVLYNDADKLAHLAVSKDRGKTWTGGSKPVIVSAPGVTATVLAGITVKAPGTIAIAYYGSTDGTKYDGYLAESTDALDAQPVFTSVTVNDPADPLFPAGFDSGYANLGSSDLVEYVQVKYAPSGDIWASFVKEMCPGGKAGPACTWDYAAHASSVHQGAVGRLVHGK
jgi:hypothetical protein